jgi:hypothetical protein
MAFSVLRKSWLTLTKRRERVLRAALRASRAFSCALAKIRNRPASVLMARFKAATCA